VRVLVGEYCVLLKSVLRAHPQLRPCLKRCRHCGILFLTHPRNAKRDDLRCGFGCRQEHRRVSAIRRSVEYYRSRKDIKRALNRRRYLNDALKGGIMPRVLQERAADEGETAAPVLDHLRVVVSLIEGRRVGLEEIKRMLARNWRQHSMVRERRMGYILRHVSARGS
jgi:hypothetical protein